MQLNAFCTQVTRHSECISQATKDEIIAKLFKRLRNLVYVFILSFLLVNYIEHPFLSYYTWPHSYTYARFCRKVGLTVSVEWLSQPSYLEQYFWYVRVFYSKGQWWPKHFFFSVSFERDIEIRLLSWGLTVGIEWVCFIEHICELFLGTYILCTCVCIYNIDIYLLNVVD